ncbi:MAG: Phosphoesterase, PA-phosphatase related protein [Parcubacteria group bacterium GW2011_GWC2_39_14]|nr:MAG: Phosphoesterase, PA-phosphatase related protein [Parcubacteria group bacterium GW2011_GWC2_39_14]KKR53942.1 MAG: Phosphoesterase, PA-phosphatase related protein [Parcubacteria group bacterium GW2011_GWA2_40_23]
MIKLTKSLIKSILKGLWNDPEVKRILAKYPRFRNFLLRRLTPDEKYGLVLTVGVIITVYFLYLFFGVVQDYYGQDFIIQADLRILNLVQVLREPVFNKIMAFITYLGGWPNVFVGVICVSVILFVQKHWHYLVTLFFAVGLGEAFVALTKSIIARPRPPLINALAPEKTYSFPSGHSFVAIAFYGLLAYFIYINVKSRWIKFFSVVGALTIIFSIGFSRIYLGAHWPSDVFSSYAVGAAWLAALITALEIHRQFPKKQRDYSIAKKKFRLTVLSVIFVWAVFIFGFYFTHPLKSISEQPKINISIAENDVFTKVFEKLSRTSEDLSGKAMEPIDLIFVGSRVNLEKVFNKQAGKRLIISVLKLHGNQQFRFSCIVHIQQRQELHPSGIQYQMISLMKNQRKKMLSTKESIFIFGKQIIL